MEMKIYSQNGEEIGKIDLPGKIFGIEVSPNLVHQAVVAQMANARKPLAYAKGRGEVSGGGRKPWRQKGTGRARHGSIRSPIWVGGGVTHGPTKEKKYSKKINKKAKRKALFMALSSKVKDNQLVILDAVSLEQVKTKKIKEILDRISVRLPNYKKTKNKQDSVLLIQPDSNKDLVRTTRNLSFTKTVRADSLNIVDILGRKYVVLLKEAIPVIEKTYLPQSGKS